MSEPIAQDLRGGRSRAASAHQRASLATRLSFTIATVLVLGLVASVLLVIQQSRRSVEREVGSELDFAASAIDAAVSDGIDARTLRDLARHLDSARHLCVIADAEPVEIRCPSTTPDDVPAWFGRWVMPERHLIRKTAPAVDASWSITLVADPRDELSEAWSDAKGLLLMLVGVTLVIQVVGFALVSRGLRPVSTIVQSLARLREGDLSEPRAFKGPRDLLLIAEGVNALRSKLIASGADNHRLLQRCLETQDEERVHVARELHDDMGQSLTAIEVDIMVARQAVRDGQAIGADDALDAASVNARSALQSLRRMLQELRPGGLDHLGLPLALQQLASDWKRRLPDVHFICDVRDDLSVADPTLALHLYRIAQEAMTNIARHADASEVLLRLRLQDDALQLTVADNGRGLPAATQRRGLGLVGMRERVAALRGSLSIDSQPRRGCRLDIRVPARA